MIKAKRYILKQGSTSQTLKGEEEKWPTKAKSHK